MSTAASGREPLIRGDRAIVVSPAGAADAAALTAGIGVLRSWGLLVDVAPHIGDDPAHYLAASDDERLAAVAAALTSDHQLVICADGGYGSQRILDHLPLLADLPWIVGSSDITALLNFATRSSATTALLGPMMCPIGRGLVDDYSLYRLRRVLFGDCHPGEALLIGGDTGRTGEADGQLVGGNLSLLASSIGTMEGTPPTMPYLLCIEDTGEPAYRIDRMLTQLVRSGYLAHCTGVIVGTFVECGDYVPVIADILNQLQIPWAHHFPFGHGLAQHVLPLGAHAHLDATVGQVTLTASLYR